MFNFAQLWCLFLCNASTSEPVEQPLQPRGLSSRPLLSVAQMFHPAECFSLKIYTR